MPLTSRKSAEVVTPRRLFILIGVAAAVVIIAFRAQALFAERARILEQSQTQAQTLAQFAATYTQGIYDSSSRIAEEIGGFVQQRRPSPQVLADYLEKRAKDTSADEYFVVLDTAGRVVAASDPGIAPGSDFGGRLLERRIQAANGQVETVMRSTLTGAVIYPYSQKLTGEDGKTIGVLGVNLRPQGIRSTAQRRPSDAQLSVWRRDGTFIAASFLDFTTDGQPMAPKPPGGIGIPGTASQQDRSLIVGSAPAPGWPLVGVASFDKTGVLQVWRRELYANLGLMVLVLLGLGVLVWFGVRTADQEQAAKQDLEHAGKVAKAALRDRDLLLKEVHHRVKNSLVMASSLLHLQARQFSDPQVTEAFEDTRKRLTSISLVHEALYSGSSFEEVNLAGYVERLVAEINLAYGATARGITLRTEIDPLMLAPSQVTPLGLILTEAITNAFKHAFRDGDNGEITVSARSINVGEIELTVRDNGQGFDGSVSPQTGSGLGSRLIRALADQLHAVVSITNDGGAAFRMIFPKLANTQAVADHA